MTHFDFINIDGSLVYAFSTRANTLPHPVRANPHALEYEHEVSAVLARIRTRRVGRALLDALGAAGHRLTIVPTSSTDNAGAVPLSPQGRDAFPSGQPVRGANSRVVNDAAGRPVLGTGAGADSVLLYQPRHINPEHLRSIPPGARADEVLLHELFHSLRHMHAGLTNLPNNTPFGNEDEFMAVVVADIYASEGGATELRGNHGFHGIWQGALGAAATEMYDRPGVFTPNPQTLSQRFADRHRDLFDRFLRAEGALFHRLAEIPAHFNPVRDFQASRALGLPVAQH